MFPSRRKRRSAPCPTRLAFSSFTATARELHLTQSAISKALSRLRAQFNDPLFLRVSKGLVPTPFAQNLR